MYDPYWHTVSKSGHKIQYAKVNDKQYYSLEEITIDYNVGRFGVLHMSFLSY